jgi:hypothetical protein
VLRKAVATRFGEADSAFRRIASIWKNGKLKTEMEIRFNGALVLSILLYGVATLSITVRNVGRLEATH